MAQWKQKQKQNGVPNSGPIWARMHLKVVGTSEVRPTFEVCTTDVLDSMKLPTSALVLTVDRRSKF